MTYGGVVHLEIWLTNHHTATLWTTAPNNNIYQCEEIPQSIIITLCMIIFYRNFICHFWCHIEQLEGLNE